MVNVKPTGWIGWIYFTAALLIIIGGLQIIAGLTGIFNPNFYEVTQTGSLIAFNFTTWGWIHLLLGVGVLASGAGLALGKTWAQIIGGVLVVLVAIAQLAFIAVYPFWSVSVLIISIFVLYAITVHGDEVKA